MGKSFMSALLLAAGEAKRMGRPKLLLPLGDRTIFEVSLGNLVRSRVDEVIVVLGHRADDFLPLIRGKKVKAVINPHYSQGMSTSLRRGLDAVASESQGLMIALADQPFIPPEVIDLLIEAFLKGERGIVLPTWRGRRGHPVILSLSRYGEELRGLTGDKGAREILERHKEDILEVEVECRGVIEDIDDEAQYKITQSINHP